MSDNADQESKTFDPTPRRLKKSREDGEVAKSREVATAAIVLAGGIAFLATGQAVMASLVGGAQSAFSRSGEAAADMGASLDVLVTLVVEVGVALIPFTLLVLGAAVLAHIAQAGILIAPKALLPKFSRINPFSRMKEVLGPAPALMRAGVALLKIIFVGLVVAAVASTEVSDVELAGSRGMDAMLLRLGSAVIRVLLSAGLALCVVALIDFSWQRYRHIKKLKMTREEIKQENKDEEGAPEIKGKRKHMYRELTLNRVLEEVPRADVVVTNPSHFAVALRYEAGQDGAPRVVAKGIDALALTIRRVARQNSVPIVENRLLARALWRKVKVGRPIPTKHFQAVAEVLAHVYRIKHRHTAGTGVHGGRPS